MARVVSLCRYPSSDEKLLQYLDALDWVLDDSHIDEQECAEIAELSETLGISGRQRDQAHRAYLRSIIAAVERDGIVTENEHVLITRIAASLGISDLPIPDGPPCQQGAAFEPTCGFASPAAPFFREFLLQETPSR